MRESASRIRARIERGQHDASEFRAELLRVPPADRDAWLDAVLGLGAVPGDGPDLPRGCVPYFPCSVDAMLRMVEQAPVLASDVFVDVGCGQGRAAAFVHLLTGAAAVGVEVQSALVRGARELATRLGLPRVSFVEGDAASVALPAGTIFFLYCPFSGDRLAKVLAHLEAMARTRPIRVACVDLPLPAAPWLAPLEPGGSGDLKTHRSIFCVREASGGVDPSHAR